MQSGTTFVDFNLDFNLENRHNGTVPLRISSLHEPRRDFNPDFSSSSRAC
jgi:hypothetical protein